MKILIIGFLTFLIWAASSSYIYVCKIKGFCDEPNAMQISTSKQEEVLPAEKISKPEVKETSVIPESLIVYFAFDKSDFKPDAKTEKYFNESNAYLKQNLLARLKITGHTDAIGTDEYNQALGYRRAQSVKQYFENEGIPAEKISIESKGEIQPVDNNSSQEGRANNRRTVLTIKK